MAIRWIRAAMYYLADSGEKITVDKIKKIVKTIKIKGASETMSTVADIFRKEGERTGFVKGKLEGKQTGAKRAERKK